MAISMQSRLVFTSHSRQRRAKSTVRPTIHPSNPTSTNPSPGCSTPTALSKSRKRTLSLLSNGDDYIKQLDEQLAARDSHITELNDQIVGLKAVMKLWEGQSAAKLDRQLKAANEEREKLAREKMRLEAVVVATEEREALKEGKWQIDREMLEETIAKLTEESEKLKLEAAEKAHSELESKSDLSKLSTILQEMSKMNSNFKDRIEALNNDMEQLSKDRYELSLRIQGLQGCEAEADRLRREVAAYELRISNEPDAAAKLAALEASCQSGYQKLVEVIRKAQDAEVVAGLKEVAGVFVDPKVKRLIGEADIEDFQSRMKAAKKENEELNFELDKVRKELEAQRERTAFLEKERELRLKEHKNEINSYSQKMQEMEETLDKSQKDCREIVFSDTKLQDFVTKLKAENSALQSKLSLSRSQLQDCKRQLEAQRVSNHTLQSDLLQAKALLISASSAKKGKDRASAELEYKLAASKEELWKKETELLRKESHRIRLEEELRALQSQNVQLVKVASGKTPVPGRKGEESSG